MDLVRLKGVKQNRLGTTYEMVRVSSVDAQIDDGQVEDVLLFDEVTAPDNPAANKAVVFVRDNGSGKTQLCARFPTGAVVPIVIEP